MTTYHICVLTPTAATSISCVHRIAAYALIDNHTLANSAPIPHDHIYLIDHIHEETDEAAIQSFHRWHNELKDVLAYYLPRITPEEALTDAPVEAPTTDSAEIIA